MIDETLTLTASKLKRKRIIYSEMPLGTMTEMAREIVKCACGRNGQLSEWRSSNTRIVRHVDRVVDGKPELYDFCLNGANSLPAIFLIPKPAKPPAPFKAKRAKPQKGLIRRSNPRKSTPEDLYSQHL